MQPLADARCVVTDTGSWDWIPLRFHGKAYALIEAPTQVELRANESVSTVHVVSDRVDLIGDVLLADISLRPRAPRLVDGWLEIRTARIASIAGDSITLDPVLPGIVTLDGPPPATFPCADLALTERPDEDDHRIDMMTLRAGRLIELRRTPGGKRLATIELAPIRIDKDASELDQLDVRTERATRVVDVLERRRGWTRIRIEDFTTAIEAWVASKALTGYEGTLLGGFLGHMPDTPQTTFPVVCTRAVPVYVRDADDTVEVGSILAGATIQRLVERGDDIPIALGHHPWDQDAIQPHVRAVDLADCTAAP